MKYTSFTIDFGIRDLEESIVKKNPSFNAPWKAICNDNNCYSVMSIKFTIFTQTQLLMKSLHQYFTSCYGNPKSLKNTNSFYGLCIIKGF